MGAFFIASMSMFTSCKDYDDDINKNTDAIAALQSQLQTLQSAQSSLDGQLSNAKTNFDAAIAALQSDIQNLKSTAATHATQDWVKGQGYATTTWVGEQGYATQVWVTDKGYVTTTAMNEAIKALDDIYAKKTQIDVINEAIEGLKTLIAGKADKSELTALSQELNNKISEVNVQLATLAGQIPGVKQAADDALEAAKTANASIANQQKLIDELTKALNGKAADSELNKLFKTVEDLDKTVQANKTAYEKGLEALQGEVNSLKEEITIIKGNMPGSNESLVSAIAALQGRVTALEGIDWAAMQAQIDAATTVGQVQTMIQAAENTLRSEIKEATGFTSETISVLNFLVEKGLTSIVLKPAYYLGGLEAIDLPMVVRQPEIFLNPNRHPNMNEGGYLSSAYFPNGTPGNKDLKQVDPEEAEALGKEWVQISQASEWSRGDRYEQWVNLKGQVQTTEEGIHWPDGLENYLPAKLGSLSDTYSYWDNQSGVLFNGNFAYNYFRYVDIIPLGHATYHINPTTASLQDQTLKFYCNYPYMTLATNRTRDAINEPENMLYQDKELTKPEFTNIQKYYNAETGLLNVPFHLNLQNYLNSYARNIIQAYDAANGYGGVAHYLNQEGYAAEYGSVNYSAYDTPYVNATTGVLFDNAWNQEKFPVDGYDTGLNELSLKMPFVAAQISGQVNGETRTVTSDYAVITPSFIQLLALADNAPELNIAPAWSTMDHNTVEQNHLYRSVEEAIAGQATHQLVYDDEKGICLDDFIEAHAYRFGTMFSRDMPLTQEQLEELGLRFEYALVDWTDDKYEDSESAHATLINTDRKWTTRYGSAEGITPEELDAFTGNTIRACVVNAETGVSEVDKVGDVSCIGREPIVRVMLVNRDYLGENHILLKGYVKFRIVRQLEKPEFAQISLNPGGQPVFMGCISTEAGTVYSGLAAASWSQMERYILDQIHPFGDKSAKDLKLSKAEFDQIYMLEMNPGYLGAKRYAKWNDKFYDEATYVKELEATYKTGGLTLEQSVLQNIEFAKAYYRAFAGYVGYTGWVGTSSETPGFTFLGLNDILARQQNVLFWVLGCTNNANAHTYINGSVSTPQADERYIEYLAAVGPDGKSTQEIETYVKFIPRNGVNANPVYVRLYIPAGKLIWAAGEMTNHDAAYWYKYNKEDHVTKADLANKTTNDPVAEVHVNTPIQKTGYTVLNENDYIQDMSIYFIQGKKWGIQFTNLVKNSGYNLADFYGFTGNEEGNAETTNLSQDRVSFYFTYPSTEKKNAEFDAWYVTNAQRFDSRAQEDTFRYTNNGRTHAVKVWQVRGHSGKKYTLTLANKDFATGKIYTWEIKRKLDTKEVRDYAAALYEKWTTGSISKLFADGTHTSPVEDVKSLYGKVQPVERGNVIVAIREVGYNLPNDVFKASGLSDLGYNPMTEVIYDEPVEICQLTDKANWGANREDVVLTTSSTLAVPNNNYFRFHNNAIAEDILNNQSKCNNYEPSAFGPEEAMDWSKYDGAFTAYVEVVFNDVDACAVCDEGCYEIFDPNNTRFFNIRCDRPVYMTSWKGDEIKQDALNKEVSTQISFGFEDWRPYTISTNYESDGDKYVLGSYYELALDADYYGGVTNGYKKDKNNWNFINIPQALIDEIRTDAGIEDQDTKNHSLGYRTFKDEANVEWEYKDAYDPSKLYDRIKINALPVASRFATNAHLQGGQGLNAGLYIYGADASYGGSSTDKADLNTGGNKLWYRNTDAHVRSFNLYVPCYYTYVFGNGELSAGKVSSFVNTLVANEIYGADYWDGATAGYAKSTPADPVYVYFKDRRYNSTNEVNLNYQDWMIIRVMRTTNAH